MNTAADSVSDRPPASSGPLDQVPSERYALRRDAETAAVPRLGVGAYAVVLDGVDHKSGGDVAIKLVQLAKGVVPAAEAATRERFFDREIAKIKTVADEPYLLEYVDDVLLRHDRLVLLRHTGGRQTYELHAVDSDDVAPEASERLRLLNAHLDAVAPDRAAVDGGAGEAWYRELFERRAALRRAVLASERLVPQTDQILNGQRFLITKKYQTTLTRLLVQQPNLTVDERLELLLELVKALKQIHARGITHGDLCPDNIMFKVSLQRDRDLVQELREAAIPTRYLYELQSVLIDLGRVRKTDVAGDEARAIGLPVYEANNRIPYAPMEMVSTSERLPFERYVIRREARRLVLEPVWEFEAATGDDALLGELAEAEDGPGGTPAERISHGRRLGQRFARGDVLYNSTWGFVVEEAREERVYLRADELYRYDAENRQLCRTAPEALLATGGEQERWEFDDVIYVNYQQGIPADLFAMGMVIVETLVGGALPPGALREFSDRCKTLVPGRRTADELAAGPDLAPVAREFEERGLSRLFRLVLGCLVRGEPSLGYYCKSHGDERRMATIRLLRDFTEFRQNYVATRSDARVEAQLRDLQEQLKRYKAVLGPDVDRTAMYQDMAATLARVEGLEQRNRKLSEELTALQETLASTRADLEQAWQRGDNLQAEKATTEQALVEARTTINELRSQLHAAQAAARAKAREDAERIEDLERQLAGAEAATGRAEGDLAQLRERLQAFVDKHGGNFRKSVKGWFSRKPAAELLEAFRETLGVALPAPDVQDPDPALAESPPRERRDGDPD